MYQCTLKAMADCDNSRIDTMQNYREKFLLKGTHVLASVFLIAISILVILGMLIIRHNIVILKPYLEFHVSKPLLLLLFGSILLIATGFLGIFAAIHNWLTGIQTFILFVSCLLISMIGMSAVLSFTIHSADGALRSRLIEHVGNYSIYSDDIDNIQLHLSCCGVDNFTDYNLTLDFIPGSCCKSNSSCAFGDVANLNLDGCYDALKILLNYCTQKLIIVLVVLGSIEIVSIVLSLLFIRSLKTKVHGGTEAEGNDINCEDSLQITRVSSVPLDQTTLSPNSNSSSVFQKTPEAKYDLPMCNYVRRPVERNIVVDYRNPHEYFLRSPPQQRYDRRICQSSPKRMTIRFPDYSK